MNVKSPTRSRDKALQTLYEIEVGGHDLSEINISIHSDKKNSFYQDLLNGVIKEKDNLDEAIQKNMDRPIERLDIIEKNSLRIALYELMNKDLDKAIVINEAIRVSKKYGSVEGYKLVNAVLDNFVKEN
tara:strand:- start:640 stop:1026 length:387 start_codon:yes stop_codon:yes gene_type:complete